MKYRNGFVSNSSSSSFICVAPYKMWEEMYAEFTEVQKEVASKFYHKKKIGDQDCIYAFFPTGDNGEWVSNEIESYSDRDENIGEWFYDLSGELEKKAKSENINILCKIEDC